MTTCFFDIETIPPQTQEAIDRVAARVRPPASMKKEETIQKWEQEQKPGAILEAVHKAGMNPAYGHVCTIGWAIGTGLTEVTHMVEWSQESEAEILRQFFDALNRGRAARFVGHNITGFDIRFLTIRAIILGVTLPRHWPRDPKPWSDTIVDLMHTWAGHRDMVSLDEVCFALGIPGKGEGLDGASVATAWEEGRHSGIIEYCRADVERNRQIYDRMAAVNLLGPISA